MEHKQKSEAPTINVLYASETGTSESESKLLALQLEERGYITHVSSLDDFPLIKIPEQKYIVFFVSTTGQGDPPKNMIKFWSFILNKNLPSNSLQKLNFTVFGFGDSSYKKYNAMARMLFQRMQQLGGKCFLERGLGDDRADGGYTQALVKWKKTLFERLIEVTGFGEVGNEAYSGLKRTPVPPILVEHSDGSSKVVPSSVESILSTIHHRTVSVSKVISNNQMTPNDHWQDVREFSFSNINKTAFKPGDTALLYPENVQNLVDELLNTFSLKGDEVLTIHLPQVGPVQLTSNLLFKNILDLSSPPRYFFFKLFSLYTTQELYKEKIQEMDFDAYYEYAIRDKRGLVEILREFKGIHLPLDILVSFVGWMKPREYSVASSYLKDPSLIRLSIALVNYKTIHNSKLEFTFRNDRRSVQQVRQISLCRQPHLLQS